MSHVLIKFWGNSLVTTTKQIIAVLYLLIFIYAFCCSYWFTVLSGHLPDLVDKVNPETRIESCSVYTAAAFSHVLLPHYIQYIPIKSFSCFLNINLGDDNGLFVIVKHLSIVGIILLSLPYSGSYSSQKYTDEHLHSCL